MWPKSEYRRGGTTASHFFLLERVLCCWKGLLIISPWWGSNGNPTPYHFPAMPPLPAYGTQGNVPHTPPPGARGSPLGAAHHAGGGPACGTHTASSSRRTSGREQRVGTPSGLSLGLALVGSYKSFWGKTGNPGTSHGVSLSRMLPTSQESCLVPSTGQWQLGRLSEIPCSVPARAPACHAPGTHRPSYSSRTHPSQDETQSDLQPDTHLLHYFLQGSLHVVLVGNLLYLIWRENLTHKRGTKARYGHAS